MRRYAVLTTLLISASSPGFAAVTAGSPAPAITLDQLIPNRPVANATLSSLSGKAVVLEFWATWCAPCIDAIPHLNELVEQFKDRPIQFISITDEEPPLVEGFLRKRPIGGWVGIDRKKQSSKAYGFNGIPQTVLIDATGKFVAMAHPSGLKASHIEDLLAGKAVTLPRPPAGSTMTVSRADDGGPAPVIDALIRPATSDNSGYSRSATKFSAKGATLRALLVSVYSFLPDRIEGEPVQRPERYDVSVSLPGAKGDALQALLQQVVCAAFHLEVSRETRDTDVFVLTAPNGKPAALIETASTGGSMTSRGKGQLKLIGNSLSSLANVLGDSIHKPVLDETGLAGKYDLELKYDDKAPDGLIDAVRNRLGLTLEPARRPVEFLIVR